MTEKICRSCNTTMPPASRGRGRPAVYCSTGCRRAVEYEVKRVTHALIDVERHQLAMREVIAGVSLGMGRADLAAKKLEFWDAEHERLTQRLRYLLDDQEASK